MARFVAEIASFRVLRTVSGNVTGPLAIVTVVAHAVAATFRTTACNMTRLSAIVARWIIGTLVTVLGEMTFSIATVTSRLFLLTVTRIVPNFVTFMAFVTAPAVTASATGITSSSWRGAFAGKMAGLITFVADA